MAKTATKPAKKAAPVAEVRASAPPPAAPPVMPPEVLGEIPLDQIRPCPFNLRKSFPDDDIAGLAESIRSEGLLARLVVRPVGANGAAPEFAGGKWKNLSHFELADGERRLRALRLLNETHEVKSVPIAARPLTDEQVRALMLVSREQSRDLSASELVVGYTELARGKTVEQLAQLVGKTVSHVRKVLALAKLPAWALAAVDAGTLPRATAELVARVPGELSRKRAAILVIENRMPPTVDMAWADRIAADADKKGISMVEDLVPLSSRDAKDLIRNHFTVELKGCPFDRKSLDLVPEAGSCEACPKRAGNDPEAVAEKVRADVCLDPDCYRNKVAAYRAREIARAAEKGIESSELDDVGYPAPKGWAHPARPPFESDLAADFPIGTKRRDEPVKDLVGKADVPKWLAFDKSGKAVLLFKTSEVRKTLQAAGVLKKPEPRPKTSQAERTANATARDNGTAPKPSGPSAWEIDQTAATHAAKVLREHAQSECSALDDHEDAHEDGPIRGALELACRAVCYEWSRSREGEKLLRQWVVPDGDFDAGLDAAICAMRPSQVIGLLVAVVTWWETNDGPNRPTGESLLAFAELDWPQLREQARRELTGEPVEAQPTTAQKIANAALPSEEAVLADPDSFQAQAAGTPLATLKGFPATAAAHLAAAHRLRTVEDVDRRLADERAKPKQEHATYYDLLRWLAVPGDALFAAGDALADHRTAGLLAKEEAEKASATKPKGKSKKGAVK